MESMALHPPHVNVEARKSQSSAVAAQHACCGAVLLRGGCGVWDEIAQGVRSIGICNDADVLADVWCMLQVDGVVAAEVVVGAAF